MRIVVAIVVACLLLMGTRYVRETVTPAGADRPPDAAAPKAAAPPAALDAPMPEHVAIELPREDRAVDKPECRTVRAAVEAAGVFRADHESPHGQSVFFKPREDVGLVLTCIVEPMLSFTFDDKGRAAPPARFVDMVAAQSGKVFATAPARIKAMAVKCDRQARADAETDVHDGDLEVDCGIPLGARHAFLYAVSRHEKVGAKK